MDNRKIKTAWLFQKYDGCSFFASGVMEQLHSQNYSMTCIYLEKRSDAHNILEDFGCRVMNIGHEGTARVFNPFVLWRLSKFLRDNEIDVLHCHRHKATFYGSLAASIARTPVIISHVHGLKRTRTLFRRLVNCILYRIVGKVIVISESVRRDVLESNPRLPVSKVIIIRNSIDFKKFDNDSISRQEAREIIGLSENAFIFGTVGRLVPTKGHKYLISAFVKVWRTIPNAHLVVLGNGKLEAELKEQAARLGCADAITFAGRRNDVPQLLRAFDVFVLSSIAEGLGVALLEAMAASLPCIASAVGGIPEIIYNEEVGYLVPPQDPDALSAAMIACYSAPEQDRRRMGEAASKMVEQFYSDDLYVEKLDKIYKEELIKNRNIN